MRDTKERFSYTTVCLHWIVGLSIISLLAVGTYMAEFEAYNLYPIHKSIGMLIFVIILGRVAWRLINGWPAPAANYKKWEHNLAVVVHWTLLIGTIIFPISGMIMSGAAGHGLAIFGLEVYPYNPDPQDSTRVIALNETMASIAHETHEILGKVFILAVTLHIAGALKHHLLDKDGTLGRMLGKKIGQPN